MIGFDFTSDWNKSSARSFNPFNPKSDLIDFTLFNARRFYSSKGHPFGVNGLSQSCASGHKISFGFTSDWTKSVTSSLSQSCASCHMIDCNLKSD